MVYIAPDGSTQKNRSKWGLSIIFDMFCSLIGFLQLFFSSIVYPPAECLVRDYFLVKVRTNSSEYFIYRRLYELS